jgi:toxin HigB-1
VIVSFRCEETRKIWNGEVSRRFPREIHRVALRKLEYLNAAVAVEDLRQPPGNHLEQLRGNRVGQHSIRINDQWRICFRWQKDGAHDVEIVDYH